MSVEAKQQKQLIIDEIKGKLENAQAAVIIDYMGITVEQADAIAMAKSDEKIAAEIAGKTIVKELYVKGRLVNIVVK